MSNRPDDCSRHPTNVPGYSGTLEDLAKAVGFMKYSYLSEFLHYLSDDMRRQSRGDKRNNKPKLSSALHVCGAELRRAANVAGEADVICNPYMVAKEASD